MRLTVLETRIEVHAFVLGDFDPEERPLSDAKILKLLPQERPVNRSVCAEGERPCPWVSCRYHLYLDVRGDGVLRVNFPDREPDELLATCALDMAADGPRTLDAIAALMGMSKERARQIEASALQKLREALGADELLDDVPGRIF